MSLFWTTFLTGLILAAAGASLLWKQKLLAPMVMAFPRSQRAGMLTMSLASVWFLSHILQLSEADFGAYRGPLFIGFGAIAVLSWIHVREFIAVRGLAILFLLGAHILLTSAFGQYEVPSRLFLVSFAYFIILVGLYIGASPFRLRDFFQWMFATDRRTKTIGGLIAAYGLLLVVVAVAY